jgi:O-antigen/teichoic acid export membrane protein
MAYGLGVAITRLAALFLLPLYTRYLAPADYGALDTLITLTSLLSPLLLFGGVDMGVQILYFQLPDKERQDDLIISAVFFVAGFAAICVIGGFIASPQIVERLFQSQEYKTALQFLFLDLWLITLLKLFLDSLRLDHQPILYNAMTFSQILLATGFNILFVVFQGRGVAGYTMGLMYGDLVITIVAGCIVFYRHRCWPSFRHTRELVRIGLPLLPVSAAYWVINLSNRFFMTQYVSMADIGLYGIANRLATGFSILSIAVQLGWRPFALSVQSKTSSFSLYAAMPLYYITFVGGIGLAMVSISPWILGLVTASGFLGAAAYVAPLTFAQVMYGLYFIVSTGLEIQRKTYHLTWTVMVAALVSIGGNAIFIPRWGAFGATIVIAIAYTLSCLLVGIVSNRVYPLPYDKRRLLILSLLMVTAYGAATFLLQYSNLASLRNAVVLILLSTASLSLLIRSELIQLWSVMRQWLLSSQLFNNVKA